MERYGTVPKKFTKDWWPYFWDYYKWRVIGIALAIVIIVVTCVQCATREKYDFHILYTGRMTFSDNHVETIQNALNERIEDVDGDGKTNISVKCEKKDCTGAFLCYNCVLRHFFPISEIANYYVNNSAICADSIELICYFPHRLCEYYHKPLENWKKSW